ncbi:MAG: thiamine pyrophosphate-dependent enzyme [Clostridia bacterium]
MPKSQYVNYKELLKPSKISFKEIDVCQYNKTISEEKKNFKKKDFLRIFNDMAIIREFEEMIYSLKVNGEYMGVDGTYEGPAHLSQGQEAVAVGQAYLLTKDDFIFGSHRSHGEIIAKGLSCIEKLTDSELLEIMRSYNNGEILNSVNDNQKTVKELATDFLLYGTASEIFARKTGFQKGIGGSMHAFFLPFGIYPNNAIVGGSAPIAVGAALFKRVNNKKGVVVANAGDGAVGCGPCFEAMNMAAMDQLKLLWEEGYKGGLPILFNFNNNQYGMGGQTKGETMAYDLLARIGAGVTPNQMHARRIDGCNPLAVIDAMRSILPILKKGEGPVLLDSVTYRYAGHSTSDISAYRTKEELENWREVDPLVTFRKKLVSAKIEKDSYFENRLKEIKTKIQNICKKAVSVELSPYIDLEKNPRLIEDMMFSKESKISMDSSEKVEDLLIPDDENSRVIAIKAKSRFYKDESGKEVSKLRSYNIRDAVFEAVLLKYNEDRTFISYGEDVRDWGGAFGCYRDLMQSVPYKRLFNSPISEAAIVGSAVGYAMAGGRAVVELMYCDFIGRAGDEIINQLAKWQAMSGGILKMPITVRVSVGAKYGAQHSQDLTALVSHIPGLFVCFPVTPYDTKGLLSTALNGTDPVIFFESQRLYDKGEMFHKGGVPKEDYKIPIGVSDIKREGSDITILTIGATLYKALEAADILEEKYNVSAEVIDARSLVPFDYDLVLKSVAKTGKILLASDAVARGSFLNDIARNITEMAFDELDAPPVVVGARNWITPPFEWDNDFFPQPSFLIDAINEKIMPLKGHLSSNNFTDIEQKNRAKMGV